MLNFKQISLQVTIYRKKIEIIRENSLLKASSINLYQHTVSTGCIHLKLVSAKVFLKVLKTTDHAHMTMGTSQNCEYMHAGLAINHQQSPHKRMSKAIRVRNNSKPIYLDCKTVRLCMICDGIHFHKALQVANEGHKKVGHM